jgi:hypothetical protein
LFFAQTAAFSLNFRILGDTLNTQTREGPRLPSGWGASTEMTRGVVAMSRTNLLGFDACQDEVESMTARHKPLESVEKMINGASITEDEKAGLWLLAWSMRTGRVPARRPRQADGTGQTTE